MVNFSELAFLVENDEFGVGQFGFWLLRICRWKIFFFKKLKLIKKKLKMIKLRFWTFSILSNLQAKIELPKLPLGEG